MDTVCRAHPLAPPRTTALPDRRLRRLDIDVLDPQSPPSSYVAIVWSPNRFAEVFMLYSASVWRGGSSTHVKRSHYYTTPASPGGRAVHVVRADLLLAGFRDVSRKQSFPGDVSPSPLRLQI